MFINSENFISRRGENTLPQEEHFKPVFLQLFDCDLKTFYFDSLLYFLEAEKGIAGI